MSIGLRCKLWLVVGTLLVALNVSAQSMPPRYIPDPSGIVHSESAQMLWSAKPAKVVSLAAPINFSVSGNQVGLVRTLSEPVKAGGIRGVQAFRSDGAARVRLHLSKVALGSPPVLWVKGAAGDVIAFGSELMGPESDIWTPSVAGSTITIEWADGSSFNADAIGHLQPVANSTTCYLNAGCATFPDKAALSASIGQLIIAKANGLYLCTGGLINDKNNADRLLLTANHCISNQAEAASIEITWDEVESSCGANDASLRAKRTNGASLLVGSASTDVTLLRLNSLPAGRYAMGWTTSTQPAGTVLRRISHPGTEDGTAVFQQIYSSSAIYTGTSICAASPRPSFIYASSVSGGAGPGSSGAPVIIDGGYIVGQLNAGCGPNPGDGCASTTLQVDGSFASSYPVLQPYLDPAGASGCVACVANTNTACILGGRFKVTLTWHDFSANQAGAGSIIKYADNLPEVSATYGPVSESVFFSMYPSAPKSIEAIVRMLKGVGINNMYWVFLSGFATAEYTVTVTDTQTCKTWTRTMPTGASNITRDFNAFPLP